MPTVNNAVWHTQVSLMRVDLMVNVLSTVK